jgi:hypothetical protein
MIIEIKNNKRVCTFKTDLGKALKYSVVSKLSAEHGRSGKSNI